MEKLSSTFSPASPSQWLQRKILLGKIYAMLTKQSTLSSLDIRKNTSVRDIYKFSFTHNSYESIGGTESCLICGECGDSTKQLLGCVNPACKSQFCWKCVCEILLDTAVDSSYLECPCCQSPFTQTSLSRLLNGGSTSEDKSNDCKKDYNRFMADNGPEIFSRQILVSVIDDMCNNVTRRCTMDDKSSDISQRSDHVLDDENSGDYISSRRVNEIEMSLGGEQRINRDSASISKILHCKSIYSLICFVY